MNPVFFEPERIGKYRTLFRQSVVNATPEQRAKGERWYEEAHELGHTLASRYGITPEQVWRVIARLSPSVRWEVNIRQAEDLIRLGDKAVVSTYGCNKRSALAMLEDASLHLFNEKTAPKITAFYDNMAHPTKSTKVTIDRRVCSIMRIPVMKSILNPTGGGLRYPQYRLIEDIVRDVSIELSFDLPHKCQATGWVAQDEITSWNEIA